MPGFPHQNLISIPDTPSDSIESKAEEDSPALQIDERHDAIISTVDGNNSQQNWDGKGPRVFK